MGARESRGQGEEIRQVGVTVAVEVERPTARFDRSVRAQAGLKRHHVGQVDVVITIPVSDVLAFVGDIVSAAVGTRSGRDVFGVVDCVVVAVDGPRPLRPDGGDRED